MIGPASPSLSRAGAWALALVATGTMAVSYVDRQALAALAPTITKDLAIDELRFGWLGSAFAIAYLLGAPLAGRFIDRVGARRGLTTSVLAWSAVAAAHALVPGYAVLFALRILLGAAEAPSFPGAVQTVSRVLPPASRSAGFGVLFCGSSLGAAMAAWLAPTLEAHFGWRIALIGTAAVGLAWIPLWLRLTGAPGARAAMANPDRHDRPEPTGPLPLTSLLALPAVLRTLAMIIAAAPVNGFAMQWGAKLLVARHHVSQTAVRDYLWLPPLALDLGAVGFGVAATRIERFVGAGADAPPHRALIALAALLLTTIALAAVTATPWQTTLALSAALAGGGGVYALSTGDMLRRVPPAHAAAAGGMTAAAQSLAHIVAFPLVGAALGARGGYGLALVALSLWVLPGALVWLAWDPRSRRSIA